MTSGGRGRERVTPEAPSVSDDPEQIAEARRLLQQEEDAVYKEAFEELDGPGILMRKYQDALERRKDQVLPRLKRIMEDPAAKGDLRALAAHTLIALGDRSGEDFLIDAVRNGRGPRRAAALHALYLLDVKGVELDHPEGNWLILACLDDPDPKVVCSAATLCANRKIPGTEAKLVGLLEAGKGKDPLQLPNQLAQVAESPEAIRIMLDHLLRDRPAEYRGWIRSVLKRLVESPDPQISELVRVAFLRYALGYTGKMRYHQEVVHDLSNLADRTTIPVLEDIFANATDPVSRCNALHALARLAPDGIVDRALALVRATPGYDPAVSALRKWAAEEDADRIIDAIFDPRTRAGRALTVDEILLLIERLGPRGRQIVEESLERLPPRERMWATWKLEGLTLDAAIDDLRAAGVIEMSRDAVFDEIRQSRAAFEGPTPIDRSDPHRILDVLLAAGILTLPFFDITGERPHEQVMAFARNSGGGFDPEFAVQTWHQKGKEDLDAPYTVQFLYRGRLYRFGAGDRYDVKAVHRALNFALETAGSRERYIGLDFGFVFADPAAFHPIAAKYALPLADDPDTAVHEGKV